MMLSVLEGFLEEARQKVFIPVEEPYCKEGQILSQCRGMATGQPSLCGWPDLPQHALLLAAPFWAL